MAFRASALYLRSIWLSIPRGGVEAKIPVLESRQTNVQLAEFRASVVLNYSCCGVRIELA